MADHSYPFDKTDLQKINQGLAALNAADQIIAKARAAGIPVDAHDSDAKACRQFLEGIKDQFFSRKA